MHSFNSIRRKLGHFWRLPRRQQWIVLEGLMLLPLAWLALKLLGLRRSVAACRRLIPATDKSPEAALGEARTITRVLGMAARNSVPATNCLRKSLVLWFLLRQRRIPAELAIGVRKEHGELQAHAWVEMAGVVLNDASDVARHYAPFHDLARVLSPT